MAVDTSTPVPDELDARVEQMLQHMDRVHADVVNRLDPPTDERVPDRVAPADLDSEVARALNEAAEAAKTASATAEAQEAPASDESNGAVVPAATIKELDEHLASVVSEAIDDEFADGTQMVEGQSLDVPLPESSPLGELPAVAAPEAAVVPTPAPTAEPVAPANPPAPAPAPAPVAPAAKPVPAPVAAPVAKAAPTPPAPAPSKPVTPAVIVPAKPAGPTWQDRFWTIATPVMEPIAVRLGKLPVGFQHTVGWIGIVTLFMAAATWGYVLFFQETRPASQILEQQQKEQSAEPGAAGEKDEHGTPGQASSKAAEHDEKKPAAPESKKSTEPATAKPTGEKGHSEPHAATHGAESDKGAEHAGH